MLNAEDYIALRGDANRAKWLTLAIVLVVLGSGLMWYVLSDPEFDFGSLGLFEIVVMPAVFFGFLINCFVKAYHKSPYKSASSNDFYGDSGGYNID